MKKLIIIMALALCAMAARAEDAFDIVYNPNVQLQYGVYTEVELQLVANPRLMSQAQLDSKRIYWDIVEDNEPAGMELEDSQTTRASIAGTPLHTDRWCLVVRATVYDNGDSAEKVVCLNSSENPQMGHPNLDVGQDLPTAFEDRSYKVKIKSDTRLNDVEVIGNLPSGLSVDTGGLGSKKLIIEGRLAQPGLATLNLLITDDMGRSLSRQFRLEIFQSPNVIIPHPICGINQIWDPYYQACIPIYKPIYCPYGYYWSNIYGMCRPYIRPPFIGRPIHRPPPPHVRPRPPYRPIRPPHLPPQPRPPVVRPVPRPPAPPVRPPVPRPPAPPIRPPAPRPPVVRPQPPRPAPPVVRPQPPSRPPSIGPQPRPRPPGGGPAPRPVPRPRP